MCVYACVCVCICSEDILHGQRAGQLGGRFEELAKMPEKVRREYDLRYVNMIFI